jgi:hypothetical protein
LKKERFECHAIHTEFVENWKICVPEIHDLYGISDSEGKGAERLKDGRTDGRKDGRCSRMVEFLERNCVSKGIESNSPWYRTLGVKPGNLTINITDSHGTSFGNLDKIISL